MQREEKTKANFEKRAEIPETTSGHLQLHTLITCNSGQHFMGKSELLLIWRHSFRNVASISLLIQQTIGFWPLRMNIATGHFDSYKNRRKALFKGFDFPIKDILSPLHSISSI